MKKIYCYRDTAIEYLFKDVETISYSAYGDIKLLNDDADIMIFYMLPYDYSINDLMSTINGYFERVKYIINNYPNRTIFAITLHNYFYESFVFGNNELEKAINSYNEYLYSQKNVRVIDIAPFYNNHNDVFNPKYYYLYNAIINPSLAKDFRRFILDKMALFRGTRKKCLILDLDNTLWGGILGEDGLANLQISGSYPGNCFHSFQQMVLELKNQGILLGICSKNNYNDVALCFEKRDDLVLSLDDFAAKKINWSEKRLNISELAKELNIGLDSIVFIDDSPVERENIKTLDGVTVLDFPDSPYKMVGHFAKDFYRYFGIYLLTEDDVNKNIYYKHKTESEKLRSRVENEDEFIKKLKIKIAYETINDNNSDRIAQLINKTNQFNLTTRRYDKTELANMTDALIIAIKVSDKFGDLGLTGVAIVRKNKEEATIDTFLMSCRILGRKIEREFLKIVLNELKTLGVKTVIGEYIDSKKNKQTKTFYSDNGFRKVPNHSHEVQRFKYTLTKPLKYNNNYIVEKKDGK